MRTAASAAAGVTPPPPRPRAGERLGGTATASAGRGGGVAGPAGLAAQGSGRAPRSGPPAPSGPPHSGWRIPPGGWPAGRGGRGLDQFLFAGREVNVPQGAQHFIGAYVCHWMLSWCLSFPRPSFVARGARHIPQPRSHSCARRAGHGAIRPRDVVSHRLSEAGCIGPVPPGEPDRTALGSGSNRHQERDIRCSSATRRCANRHQSSSW